MIRHSDQLIIQQILNIDVRAPVFRQYHGQTSAIGRPDRRTVNVRIVGDLPALTGSNVLRVDSRQTGFKGDVSNVFSVWRPTGRHDRLIGFKQHLSTLTVIVRFFKTEDRLTAR